MIQKGNWRKKIIRLPIMVIILLYMLINTRVQAADYSTAGCVDWVKARASQIGVSLPSTGTNEYGLYGASAYWTNLPAQYKRGNEPKANALAIWKFSSNAAYKNYGHVAFVESVNGDTVTLTEGGLPSSYTYAGNTGVRSISLSKSQISSSGGCSGFLGYVYLLDDSNPTGCFDAAEGRKNAVFVSGWAFDSDSVSQAVEIHVYIGGAADSGEGHVISANQYRDDVNSVYGVGNYHGFQAEIPTSLSGIQEVYVYAINIGNGENQLIGRKTVNIAQSYSPQGSVEWIRGGSGLVSVGGWVFDLDDMLKPVELHIYIGGPAGVGESYVITADQYRDDINSSYEIGNYHGFQAEIPTLLLGNQEVYVYAIDIGGGENPLLASETVTITCNHSYENCTANNDGTHFWSCSKCGKIETSNCSYNEMLIKPTCNQIGYTSYICKDCSYSFKGNFTDCVEHLFTKYVSDNNAAIGRDGTKTAYCDYGCGVSDTITDEGSALGTGQLETEDSDKKKDPVNQEIKDEPEDSGDSTNTESSAQNTCTITFDGNGGTNLTRRTITVRRNQMIGSMPSIQRRGYLFKGWYTERTGGIKMSYYTRITKSQTLYARWETVAKPKKAVISSLKKRGKGKFLVKYRKVSGSDGYEICYSTNKKFRSSVKKADTSALSKTVKGLKKKKNYYVRVRAYKTDSTGSKVYGSYSKTKKVKV